jgi:hypothetical protein
MKNYNEDVTKYIENSEEFAKPILTELREIIHRISPEITEKIRWGHPHFDYKRGMCFISQMKGRVAFGCWDDTVTLGREVLSKEALAAQEILGHLTKVEEIPDEKIIAEYIKLAMYNIDHKRIFRPEPKEKGELIIPEYLTEALERNKKAKEAFEKMSPSHKREYVDWIVDAKTGETREKRILTMIDQVVEGKSKNWKYQ